MQCYALDFNLHLSSGLIRVVNSLFIILCSCSIKVV